MELCIICGCPTSNPELVCSEECWEEYGHTLALPDDEPSGMTDIEADADTLRSAGYGTDEDYGGYAAEDEYPF